MTAKVIILVIIGLGAGYYVADSVLVSRACREDSAAAALFGGGPAPADEATKIKWGAQK